jgi:glutaredoxin|tara:strand:+ start:944 stop:1369 length:426 start_codon:yes stop_codon:yes gene_type:complete
MKIYTNPTCHYCKKIKDSLDNANVKYEEINASENQTEWNELVRITGIGITPTILMQEEVWIPNRDFRTPEELIQRIQHFEKNPMNHLSIEERIDQVNNNVKNLVLMINQIQQNLQQLNAKQAGTPPHNPQVAKTQVQQQPQ